METGKYVARKVFALITIVAIAAAVLFVAPPATRLIIALLALPLETLIVATLFSDAGQHVPRMYQRGQHSLAE